MILHDLFRHIRACSFCQVMSVGGLLTAGLLVGLLVAVLKGWL